MPVALRTRARARTAPRPESDPRFRKVMDDLKRGAARTRMHPPAARKAQQAGAAAKGPPKEKLVAGEAKQVEKVQEAPAKKPETSSFLALLQAEIAQVMPKTLGDTEKFMKGGSAGQMKSGLKGNVTQQKEQAAGGVKSASKEAPKETGEAKQAQAIPPEPATPAPAVNGAEAMPAAKPEADVSLQDSKQDVADQMKQADIDDPQLKKANDPRFSAVLTAKDAVNKEADSAPGKYRASEKATLGQANASAQGAAKTGAAAMVAVKGAKNSAVLTKQQQAKARDEAKRLAVTNQIEAIYNETKKSVEDKLNSLDTTVNDIFDKGVDAAIQSMKDFVEDKIFKWKLERYLLKPLGAILWAKDLLLGLPDDVNVFYEQGRALFTRLMNVLVMQVADLVERTLRDAKQMVGQGRARIQALIDSQPKELQAQLKEAQQKVSSDFDSLETSIDDKKNQLAQQLAQKYKEAFDKADQELDKMRQENRGLVDKAMDAIGEVIKILTEFKAKLMALLKKGEDTIKLIIKDPIGFLGNLIAAIKAGFSQFVANIWTHLKKGFMTWLFGALAEAGIEIPSDLSLPSILKLVLSVLGITYERMRAKAVKLIGERAVSLIEKLVEYVRALITGGPAALWEKVKEDLSNLKAMVIDAIQNWLIETLIKKAIAKVVSMFNPVGAIVQAVLMIYDVVTFIIEKASQIMALVEAIINSVSAIASGAIGGAANWIEQALARFVPVVIGLLAQLIGLGGISKKIKEFILKVQNAVDKAIDKAIAKVVAMVKKLFGKLTGKDKKEERGPEHDKEVKAGLAALDTEKQKYLVDGDISREDAQKAAASVKSAHPVFKSLTVVEAGDEFDFDYVASPGNRYKGAHKLSGALKVVTWKVKDAGKASELAAAQASGAAWEEAVLNSVVKEIFVAPGPGGPGRWEIVLKVPIEINVKGMKDYKNPSREDLARLKVQKGHKAAGRKGIPEVTVEVRQPGGKGALSQVRAVEITLVEDFTKVKNKYARHKVQQFDNFVEIVMAKYQTPPVRYFFISPRAPSNETKDFIVGTLQSKGVKNMTVIWVVLK